MENIIEKVEAIASENPGLQSADIEKLFSEYERMEKLIAEVKNYHSVLVIDEYEQAYANLLLDPSAENQFAFGCACMNLASWIAYSTLNKRIDPNRKTAQDNPEKKSRYSPVLLSAKYGLVGDLNRLSNMDYAEQNVTVRRKTEVDEQTAIDLKESINVSTKETISDGMDILQSAALAIVDCTKRYGRIEKGWFYQPRRYWTIDKRVVTKTEAKWKLEELTPIQICFRFCGWTITDSAAMRMEEGKYTYIESYAVEGTTGHIEKIYRRLNRYADIGGIDSNGLYTVDTTSVFEYNRAMQELNLSANQMEIIMRRLRGESVKAIAETKNVSRTAIYNAMKKVAQKGEKVGISLEDYAEEKRLAIIGGAEEAAHSCLIVHTSAEQAEAAAAAAADFAENAAVCAGLHSLEKASAERKAAAAAYAAAEKESIEKGKAAAAVIIAERAEAAAADRLLAAVEAADGSRRSIFNWIENAIASKKQYAMGKAAADVRGSDTTITKSGAVAWTMEAKKVEYEGKEIYINLKKEAAAKPCKHSRKVTRAKNAAERKAAAAAYAAAMEEKEKAAAAAAKRTEAKRRAAAFENAVKLRTTWEQWQTMTEEEKAAHHAAITAFMENR